VKREILYGAIGLVIGTVASGLIVNNMNKDTAPADMSMTMTDMVSSLKGKTGDEFDKAFISGMIEHHQGAIDMAKLAQANAKHAEIKNMANDIMSAQSKEIDMMQTWQADWGYKTVPTSHDMMSH
jgi:uncharacterized protein (DUF305 family)